MKPGLSDSNPALSLRGSSEMLAPRLANMVCVQIRLSDPSEYQSIVDAEWNIIYDKLDKCAQSGAKIVLSRLAIGDLATQYFADRDIFCAGRVSSVKNGCPRCIMLYA